MRIDELNTLITAVCPIISVNSDGVIVFDPAATAAQKTAAEGVVTANLLQVNGIDSLAAGKLKALEEARSLRFDILARLNGIHLDAIYNNDVPPVIAAIMVAKQALKDITIHPTVIAATGYNSTKVAIMTQYYAISTTLAVNAPTAVSAFVGLDQ